MVAALALVVVTFLPALRFRTLDNENLLPENFSKGVHHVHSTFSDGHGDLDEITAAADGLDFIALTDHGLPNLESVKATQRLNGVLVIGGSEIDVDSAHLAAFGFSPPAYRFPPEPEETIDEVNRAEGVSFMAHPFYRGNPWTDWNVTNHTGIELINSHTAASLMRFSRILLAPRYFVRPRYAMLTTLEYPKNTVEAWERMNRTGRYSGIFALDAHARMSVGFGNYVNMPKYAEMFDLLNVYVKHDGKLSDEPRMAARTLVESFRAGSFFNCIELIAPANGFDAFVETNDGERVEMGGQSDAGSGRLVVRLPFEFETRTVVTRNGETFAERESAGTTDLAIEISEKGVYRVEVYAGASSFDYLPWIMGNPFFFETRSPPEEPPIPAARQPLATAPGFFKVNHDDSSQGSLLEETTDEGSVFGFRYALPEVPDGPNYFVALSNRTPRDFTEYDGLTLRVRSERRARFWLMFRTRSDDAETWYRHSFAADSEWSTISIPFEDFRVHHGQDAPPDLADVISLHISINSRIANPGASGTLQVADLALY